MGLIILTEIRKILTYNNMKIKFTDDELAKMNELNITEATIISRLKKGWPKFYIVHQPKKNE